MSRSAASVILAISAFLILCAGARAADEVRLKNGQRFTGEVEELKGGALKFKTAYGTMTIPQAEVAELKMEKPLQVTLPGAGPVSLALRTDAKGVFAIEGRKSPIAQVESILPPPPLPVPPTELGRWAGDLGVAVTWTDGNTHTLTTRGALNLVRDQSGEGEDFRNKATLSLRYAYGKSGGLQIQRQGFASFKWDLFLHPRAGAYVEGTWLYDYEGGFERKNTAGLGLSVKAVDEETLKVTLDLGVSYIGMFYNDRTIAASVAAGGNPAPSKEFAALRGMLDVLWKLPEDFDLHHKSVVYKSLNDSSSYLLDTETSLSRKITAAWAFQLAFFTHTTEPPAPGKLRTDVEGVLSLLYKF